MDPEEQAAFNADLEPLLTSSLPCGVIMLRVRESDARDCATALSKWKDGSFKVVRGRDGPQLTVDKVEIEETNPEEVARDAALLAARLTLVSSDDDDFEKMAMDEGIKPAPVPAPAPPPDNPYAQPVLGPALLPEVGGRRLCCLFL